MKTWSPPSPPRNSKRVALSAGHLHGQLNDIVGAVASWNDRDGAAPLTQAREAADTAVELIDAAIGELRRVRRQVLAQVRRCDKQAGDELQQTTPAATVATPAASARPVTVTAPAAPAPVARSAAEAVPPPAAPHTEAPPAPRERPPGRLAYWARRAVIAQDSNTVRHQLRGYTIGAAVILAVSLVGIFLALLSGSEGGLVVAGGAALASGLFGCFAGGLWAALTGAWRASWDELRR